MEDNILPGNKSLTLHLISNPKSGIGAGHTLPELAQKICQELGAELVHHPTSESQSLEDIVKKALQAALQDNGILVVAGGDGTIRTAAQYAHGTPVKFAVVPCGTFNFFARTHGIPEDQEAALKIALTGEARPVRLGSVNGQIFLINASLGLYARAIRDREVQANRWGRKRIVVILSSLMTLIRGHKRYLHVNLMTEKVLTQTFTPMIFIGNNALQLMDLNMDVADCMKADRLAVMTLKPIRFWGICKLVFHGLLRTLQKEDSIESFCADTLTIETRHAQKTVALDGELFPMTCPFEVKALPQSLNLMKPKKDQEA